MAGIMQHHVAYAIIGCYYSQCQPLSAGQLCSPTSARIAVWADLPQPSRRQRSHVILVPQHANICYRATCTFEVMKFQLLLLQSCPAVHARLQKTIYNIGSSRECADVDIVAASRALNDASILEVMTPDGESHL